MSLLKKPLSLQRKSDSDVQPMTFGKKRKTGEAAITNRTLSLKNMCQYQGKQSCLGEELALQDVSVEEDSSFMELQNVRKKPKCFQGLAQLGLGPGRGLWFPPFL